MQRGEVVRGVHGNGEEGVRVVRQRGRVHAWPLRRPRRVPGQRLELPVLQRRAATPPPSPELCAGRLTRARVADEPCLANSNCYICTQDPFCSWRFDNSECVFATNSIRASEASAKTLGGTPATTYNGETCHLAQSNIYYLA